MVGSIGAAVAVYRIMKLEVEAISQAIGLDAVQAIGQREMFGIFDSFSCATKSSAQSDPRGTCGGKFTETAGLKESIREAR